ncbi:MAG TPA: metalloregulator ArsR/SmtB family transcription factor [Fibrobacteraceae bacterium]|nr:metalloregulator ArsR/SmtB family transcription factor [Fibrobacteraceae bacterium]
MADAITPSLKLFRIIADETRLKILMILEKAEVTVGELVRVLEIHQSNTSRHLQQLRDGDLVDDRREGALVYYRWSESLRANPELQAMLKAAWNGIAGREAVEDHLEALLAQRRLLSQQFFDSVAGRYSKLAEPGGGADALLRALASLLRFEHAVDIGCGEGSISLLLARGCRNVTAIDQNQKMLEILSDRFAREGFPHIRVRQGDMEHLPLEDACADLAVLSQVLHHAIAPESALAEMLRILKPGGYYVLLDLLAHDQDWVRERLGDQWLGFDQQRIASWLQNLNCPPQLHEVVHVQDGLPTLLLIGRKS